VHRELTRSVGTAQVLGAFRTAVYLELPSGAVIAMLTQDAVALPIGIVLPVGSQLLDLSSWAGPFDVAGGAVRFGELIVRPNKVRDTALPYLGEPDPAIVAMVRRWLSAHAAAIELPDPGLGIGIAIGSGSGTEAHQVAALIGRGPGLTPSGDDLLCGLLAGGPLFGRAVDRYRQAIEQALEHRPRATTSLSKQLLLRACAGDGIAEIERFAHALVAGDPSSAGHAALRRTTSTLLQIGHSSGIALATGLLMAAELPPYGLSQPEIERNDR
jgi:hypothetical protein